MDVGGAWVDAGGEDHHKNKEDRDTYKMGFLDVAAFIIAAFQILLPYMLIFILTLLLVPALIFGLVRLLGH